MMMSLDKSFNMWILLSDVVKEHMFFTIMVGEEHSMLNNILKYILSCSVVCGTTCCDGRVCCNIIGGMVGM